MYYYILYITKGMLLILARTLSEQCNSINLHCFQCYCCCSLKFVAFLEKQKSCENIIIIIDCLDVDLGEKKGSKIFDLS